MKNIRITHPELPLIIKAGLDWQNGVVITNVKFGLPTKASKLEKLLLKYIEIYCYDVFRNNMQDIITTSEPYKKFEKDQWKIWGKRPQHIDNKEVKTLFKMLTDPEKLEREF